MEEKGKQIVRFEELNVLGKAVYAGGAAAYLAAVLIEKAIGRAADLVVETERAFRSGKDPNTDDAVVLEEDVRSGRRR